MSKLKLVVITLESKDGQNDGVLPLSIHIYGGAYMVELMGYCIGQYTVIESKRVDIEFSRASEWMFPGTIYTNLSLTLPTFDVEYPPERQIIPPSGQTYSNSN